MNKCSRLMHWKKRLLAEWLEERQTLVVSDDSFLFCTEEYLTLNNCMYSVTVIQPRQRS